MRRPAQAPSAGSTESSGNSRGLFRRAFAAAAGVGSVALVLAMGAAPAAPAAEPWGFEQVTPVDKGGAMLASDLFSMVSSDSSGLVFSTRAPMGSVDPSSAPYSPAYLATRGGEGWATRGLDIPLDPEVFEYVVPYSTLLGVSRDLTHSLVVSRRVLAPGGFAGGGNIYRRDLRTDQYEFIAGRPESQYYEDVAEMGGTGHEMVIGASDSFDRLVFFSDRTALNDEAAPGVSGIYEWTADSGLVLQSRKDGEKGAPLTFVGTPYGPRNPNPVSADGRQILLLAPGINPETWEPVPGGGLYVRIDGSRTEPISYSRVAGEPTDPVPVKVSSVGASADGRFIAFAAEEGSAAGDRRLSDDAPTGSGRGLYLYDREKPVDEQLRFIAPAHYSGESPELIQVTANGTVYFKSTAQLQPGATLASQNIYVWRDGQIQLVARGGEWGMYGEFSIPIPLEMAPNNYLASPNGRYFAFAAAAPITGHDSSSLACGAAGTLANLCREAFVYDAELETIECASCPPDGGASAGNAGLAWADTFYMQRRARPVLTDDGILYFDTPNDLATADSNGRRDVYAFQAGDRRLVSRGTSGATSRLLTVADDGSKVFFITDDRLVGQDRDNLDDVYVTGAGVGIPAQNPVLESPVACSGGDCRVTSTPAPPRPSLGSADLTGKGNVRRTGKRVRGTGKRDAMAISGRPTVMGPQTTISLKARSAGRIVVSGNGVRKGMRAIPGPGSYKVKVSLDAEFRKRLREEKRVTVRVRVRFRPKSGKAVEEFVTLTCIQPTTKERAGR